MTGPEHYQEAERLLRDAASGSLSDGGPFYLAPDSTADVIAAQAHATLAVAAAMAEVFATDMPEWKAVTG